MERASPADMRRSLEMVEALRVAGILFIPMPVENTEEAAAVAVQAHQRMAQLLAKAEAEDGGDKE